MPASLFWSCNSRAYSPTRIVVQSEIPIYFTLCAVSLSTARQSPITTRHTLILTLSSPNCFGPTLASLSLRLLVPIAQPGYRLPFPGVPDTAPIQHAFLLLFGTLPLTRNISTSPSHLVHLSVRYLTSRPRAHHRPRNTHRLSPASSGRYKEGGTDFVLLPFSSMWLPLYFAWWTNPFWFLVDIPNQRPTLTGFSLPPSFNCFCSNYSREIGRRFELPPNTV